jgi:hypothetical protein
MRSGVRSIAVLSAALTLAACASASPPKAMDPIEGEIEVSATVESIDLATRQLTLRSEAGERVTVEVDPAVQNLPQVKVGDRVVTRYRQAIGAMIATAGGEQATVDVDAQTAKPGEKPSATASQTANIPVTIASVDIGSNVVNYYAADGVMRSITLETPQARAFAKQLKPGDKVVVTFTEAVALSVEPAE